MITEVCPRIALTDFRALCADRVVEANRSTPATPSASRQSHLSQGAPALSVTPAVSGPPGRISVYDGAVRVDLVITTG